MAEKAAIIFVHGLFSSGRTWSKFQKLMATDTDLADFQLLNFEYPSPRLKLDPRHRIPDFDIVAAKFRTYFQIEAAQYSKVAIVTHSQGGLITQRFLAQMIINSQGHDLERIRLIALFACPNSGSEIFLAARRSAWFWHQPQERELRPLNHLVAQTHGIVINRIVHAKSVSSNECPITVLALAGEEDNVVTPASARSVFPDTGVLPGDHSSVIQPDSVEDLAYKVLKERLVATVQTEEKGRHRAVSEPGETHLRSLQIDDIIVKKGMTNVVLDVRIRNSSSAVANLTRANVRIVSREAYAASYKPSASYDVLIEEVDNSIAISHVLQPNEVDNFVLRLGFTEFNTSCGFIAELVITYNKYYTATSDPISFSSTFA
jgi:Alpha/beta hydrolase family